MGPKKKEGKAAAGEAVDGEDPAQLLQNYQKFCKSIGLAINATVTNNLNNEELYPVTQLLIDDQHGPLGPGGTRALMTAVMGQAAGMKGGPYKLLTSIRMWKANCCDDGTASIAEVLRLGGADVKISFLELFECNIGPRGANALGSSLSFGNNLSLLTLKLDYNGTFGDEGVINLCKGLRTNSTLKQLHLQYCSITSESGPYLAELLANSRSALELLNINGNRLGGVGLASLCPGLAQNVKCETLCLADNMIDQLEDDIRGLHAFKEILLQPTVALTAVDLMFNRIGEAGAAVLIEALGPENTKIKEFLVDSTLPQDIFDQVFRKSGGKGKGKKGKKK